MNWTQIFRENLNCYALSILRVFILLASSDSDKHMLMRQKVLTKIRLYKRVSIRVRNEMYPTEKHVLDV